MQPEFSMRVLLTYRGSKGKYVSGIFLNIITNNVFPTNPCFLPALAIGFLDSP